jgi:hypothetical protein
MQVRIPVADGMFASYGPYDGCLDGSIAHLERTIGWCKKYVQRKGGGSGRRGYHRTVTWQVWLAGPPGPSHGARRRQWFRQRRRRVEPRVAWPCAPPRYTFIRPPSHRAHGADTAHPTHTPRTPHAHPTQRVGRHSPQPPWLFCVLCCFFVFCVALVVLRWLCCVACLPGTQRVIRGTQRWPRTIHRQCRAKLHTVRARRGSLTTLRSTLSWSRSPHAPANGICASLGRCGRSHLADRTWPIPLGVSLGRRGRSRRHPQACSARTCAQSAVAHGQGSPPCTENQTTVCARTDEAHANVTLTVLAAIAERSAPVTVALETPVQRHLSRPGAARRVALSSSRDRTTARAHPAAVQQHRRHPTLVRESSGVRRID